MLLLLLYLLSLMLMLTVLLTVLVLDVVDFANHDVVGVVCCLLFSLFYRC